VPFFEGRDILLSLRADTEILILPYDSALGASLLQRLIAELESGSWTRFRAAVAFVKASANYEELLRALVRFASGGGVVELTFGADLFGARVKGSDFEALRLLVEALDSFPSVRIHLYHEKYRTFHPKVYFFDSESNARALLIVGSSNWSHGGLVDNVEVDVLVHLDLSNDHHLVVAGQLAECFSNYWSEV
jgi:HKD family nuclease